MQTRVGKQKQTEKEAGKFDCSELFVVFKSEMNDSSFRLSFFFWQDNGHEFGKTETNNAINKTKQ